MPFAGNFFLNRNILLARDIISSTVLRATTKRRIEMMRDEQ